MVKATSMYRPAFLCFLYKRQARIAIIGYFVPFFGAANSNRENPSTDYVFIVLALLFYGGMVMNQYDVSGVLKTYSEKACKSKSKEHLCEIIRELKKELDLRKITFDKEYEN